MGRKLVALLGLMLVVGACGGGGSGEDAVVVTLAEVSETSVEVVESTVVLDVFESVPSTASTTGNSLFEGFVPDEDQSEMVVELDSPNVAIVEGETVFALEAPGECKETPIGIDISAKQVIFDLYWNCLYRPIVVADDDGWLESLQTGRHDRAFLRKTGVGSSAEASCIRGGSCDKHAVPVELGEGVRVECNFSSVVVPHERAGIRLQDICGNDLKFSVAEK